MTALSLFKLNQNVFLNLISYNYFHLCIIEKILSLCCCLIHTTKKPVHRSFFLETLYPKRLAFCSLLAIDSEEPTLLLHLSSIVQNKPLATVAALILQDYNMQGQLRFDWQRACMYNFSTNQSVVLLPFDSWRACMYKISDPAQSTLLQSGNINAAPGVYCCIFPQWQSFEKCRNETYSLHIE